MHVRNKLLLSGLITALLIFMIPLAAPAGVWQPVGTAGFSAGTVDYTSLYVYNGTPYVAYLDAGNGNKATVMKFNGTSWVPVGTAGFSAGQALYTSLYVYNGTPYVAYRDAGKGSKATVMMYDGTNWVNVGPAGFSAGQVEYTSLYVDNGTPYVAYKDVNSDYKATVKKLDGANWVTVGTAGFSTGQALFTSLYVDNGMPYVAYRDADHGDKATVMMYDGTSWVNVGAEFFSAGTVDNISLYVDNGTPYVAYRDNGNGSRGTVMVYDGTSWVPVGIAGFSGSTVEYPSLYIYNSTPYLAYKDTGNGSKATVMMFNGTSWVNVGLAGFSAGQALYTSLYVDNGTPYVAYRDAGNGNKATVMMFATTVASDVTTVTASGAFSQTFKLTITGDTAKADIGAGDIALGGDLNGLTVNSVAKNGDGTVSVQLTGSLTRNTGTGAIWIKGSGLTGGVASHTVSITVNPSSDAGLTSVAAQTDGAPAGGSGNAAGAPVIWSVNVPNAKAALALADIAVAANAAKNLYSDAAFTTEIADPATLSLTAGGGTAAYIKVTAQDTTTIKYYAVTVNRAAALSSDAGLISVAAQTDGAPAGGDGNAAGTPITWSVNVPNAKGALALADIGVAANAAKNLYSDAAFTTEIADPATLSLTAGGGTAAYIKVTAQDTTTIKYYAVTVNRAAALSSDAGLISVAAQTDGAPASGDGNAAGTPITWSVNVPNAKAALALADIGVAANATKNLYSDAAFTTEIADPATLSLTAGGGTAAYIKVTAQDTTTIKYYAVTVNRAAASPPSGGSSTPSRPTTPEPAVPAETRVETLVNGKTETVATVTTTKVDDKTVTTVTVDDKKIEEKLQKEGNSAVVTIAAKNEADVVVGQLNGQTVKNMETKEAVLEIKAGNVTYKLPASQLNIDNVSAQIGNQVELKDITVNVKISAPAQETVKIVEDTANKNNYQVVVKPVEFEITCTSGNKTVEVSKFNGYVERLVAIPEGIDPSRITTGIVLNPDGTFSHVPTSIVVIDGRYYARINSLTNSTYSVIYNPKAFKDVETHWAKEAINDLGSRLVISGVGEDKFEPDRDITRAEFTTITVRALGLMRPGSGKDAFGDVIKSAYYYDAVSIACEHGIISGYGYGKFGPDDKITREQAMIMIARAMKITGLKASLTDTEVGKLLSSFADENSAADYAKTNIAACVKTGIVSGRSSTSIVAKDNITRAEVAVIISRLLQKSKLI